MFSDGTEKSPTLPYQLGEVLVPLEAAAEPSSWGVHTPRLCFSLHHLHSGITPSCYLHFKINMEVLRIFIFDISIQCLWNTKLVSSIRCHAIQVYLQNLSP